jgi:uncharacterized protein
MRYPLDIGVGLVAARRARRVSQRELGVQIGVAQQQIARWEATEYRSVALERVDAVARALDLSGALTCMPTETGGLMTPVRDLGEVAARIRAHGSELAERWGVERIGVFGAFASGEQTGTSSVGVLLDAPERDEASCREAAEYLEEVLGREVEIADPALLTTRRRARVLGEAVDIWSG